MNDHHTSSDDDHPPLPESFGLTEARYQELTAAYRGAQSLVWLALFMGFTLVIVVSVAPNLESWGMILGLVALALVTSFLLMLFFSGLVRVVATWWLRWLHADFRDLQRYERARRAAARR